MILPYENATNGDGGHEQITPGALHRLVARLLEDHQRAEPHHADRCPLCQDAEMTLDLLAEQLPDGDDACATCCAPAGEDHADSCPGRHGHCPGCDAAPGDFHAAYCPAGRSSTTFQPTAVCDQAPAPIPLSISSYQLPDGTTGSTYPSSTHSPR